MDFKLKEQKNKNAEKNKFKILDDWLKFLAFLRQQKVYF